MTQNDVELLMRLYQTMVRIRAFEERVVDLYARGLVKGLAHLYVGEEAVAAGVCAALEPTDYITSTHRGHGHCIAKGADVPRMMAEIFGRANGYCKGKGGSMHIADFGKGILGAMAIVGAGLPISVGAGLSAKLRGSGQVCACFFGDGASNQGSFHEALNLASLWKLPVIFVCENNLYGISVAQHRHQAIRDVAVRAGSYAMPGVTVDGNDVLAVYEAAVEAVKRAREGGGPTLLECKTYRWRGHHEGDLGQGSTYRSREEIGWWMERCPIKRARERLLALGVSERDLDMVADNAAVEIEEAVRFASDSPVPAERTLWEDVYVE